MITGIVQYGNQRARELGFPTANLVLEEFTRSPGTWAAHTHVDGHTYPSAAYISQKDGVWTCETHLLDEEIELYDKEIRVELLSHISDVDPFETAAKMRKKIEGDISDVRDYLTE